MKVRSHKANKVNIITLGCSKNTVDSEVLLAQLKASEIDAVHEIADRDNNVVVINTCGFIEQAKQESIDTILHYIDEKEAGRVEQVYVTGCLSERYRDDLQREMPQVDAFFGTMELPALLNRLGADYKHHLLGERQTTTPFHYAYLKISEGCDRPCSFCAIPLMRGKHRSRSIESLVDEARSLAAKGVRELILIAQDSTYYGLDLYGERKLADLMRKLADVDGIEWVRLHYAFPSGFPMDVAEAINEHPHICNYLDIPLQHSSDNVLKKMRRGITNQRSRDLIRDIRRISPGIAIRTTMLVGHPGETEDDFADLCQFVRDMEFERLGVFTYSHEEGTHAYSMDDDVPEDVKEERAAILMEIQEEISFRKNQDRIGSVVKVLIDRVEQGNFVGRTEWDSPEVDNEVLIPTDQYFLRIGDFVNVQITDATEFDLFGIPTK